MGHATRSPWRQNLFTLTSLGTLLVGVWAVGAAVATATNLNLVRALELQTQSLFFQLRGPRVPPDKIVILAMDEDSLTQGVNFKELQELAPIRTWPWRRSAYARVVDRLMAAGARVVSLDIVFDAPSDHPADDQALQRTLQRHAGRITLAASQADSLSGGGGLEQLIFPDPLFQTQPGSIGFINYLLEPDGQQRRFGWVYLQEKVSADLRQSQPDITSFTEATLKAAGFSLAPRSRGDYIYFYGGQNTFPTHSFWRVLDTNSWNTLQRQQNFKDKIVLIGPTAASFQDYHFTPFGRIPGVEIHANALATLLDDRAMAQVIPNPFWQGALVWLGVLGSGLLARIVARRTIHRSFVCLGLAVVWAGTGYLVFTLGGLILPVAVPVLAIALASLSFLGTGAASDLLEQLRLRRTLERYVAAPIVEEILGQPEGYQTLLQGRKLQVAVLFCDIRGFTTLSYKLPPEALVAQLNTYLAAMVAAILDQRGTIDKFIGDAVMAEFGSPVSQGEKADAMNAIRAALRMRQALAVLRQQWQQEGKLPFYQGIGISYGEVIAGNIGSPQRLEYTVIGDAANVASRVEGLTKQFQTDILITGTLYELVQAEVDAVFVGEHQLRGRAQATALYSLVGLKGEDHSLYRQIRAELHRYLKPQDA